MRSVQAMTDFLIILAHILVHCAVSLRPIFKVERGENRKCRILRNNERESGVEMKIDSL